MKFKLITLFIILCLGFTSCSENETPEPRTTRTILVYMMANNSLNSFASKNIESMIEGATSKNLNGGNLIVYYAPAGSPPELLRIKEENGVVKKIHLKDYEKQNSADPDVMRSVIGEVVSQYPADSYGLVYWSHADGWIPYPVPSASTRWIGQDTGEGQDNRMNISDFVDVLDDGVPHFDFIMFDACFMMSVEVAYEVRNYTDYYIGSPTENPGPGAPYDKVVPYMFKPGAAAQMAEAYFNHYKDNYKAGEGISNANWTGGTSICAVRTDALDDLADVTGQLLERADNESVPSFNTVFDYDKRDMEEGHVGYYDFSQMMEMRLDADAYVAWKNVFDASIVYWNTTDKNYSMFKRMFSMEGTNGITHYIPLSVDSKAAEAYRSMAWYKAAGLENMGW